MAEIGALGRLAETEPVQDWPVSYLQIKIAAVRECTIGRLLAIKALRSLDRPSAAASGGTRSFA